ncbi:Vacuolar protein-sorting-associated protein 28 [Xylographa soralifera]|nr:Vacuolar protein-sorting-associated protein 28 [Xylographa soralifera]
MYTSSRLPSYAPSPYSYTPDTTLNATINLDEEVKLPRHGTAERELLDSLAEIYSIVVVLDDLERAYTRDSVSETEYTDICSRLIKQYNSALSDERVRREFVDLESFKKEYDVSVILGVSQTYELLCGRRQRKRRNRGGEQHMDCPRATERLRIGLPSTLVHPGHPAPSTSSPYPFAPHSSSYQPQNTPAASNPAASTPSASSIANATENFITFLDALRIKILAKDQLHPLLSEVIQSVNKVVEGDFDGRGNIIKWLIRLNGMRAGENLGEEETRECAFELEGAYAGFKAKLGD